MRRIRTMAGSIVTICLISAAASGAWSATASPSPTSSADPAEPNLADAKERVLELEEAIEAHRGDRIALEERIEVTNIRIVQQQETLAEARAGLAEARATYRDRMVGIYKSRAANPLHMLLTADTMSDFYSRLHLLTRIADRDRRVLEDALIASAEAEFQAAYLDDLKAQDIALRQMHRTTAEELDTALEQQKALVARLTAEAQTEARAALAARRQTHAKTRQQWKASSVPLGDEIAKVPGVVEPYTDRTYLVSEYHPRRYRTLGRTETAFCSWYGNQFHGRMTASGQIYNQNCFTTASRTLPFGTRLALTRGDRRIVVVVTDRGPFIAGRDLDLSRAAAQALGFSGLATVHVEYVEAIGD